MKYRGKVINNKDPMKMGRIKVYCPLIYGNSESAWCYPCVPLGFEYHIPQVGQMVWIEFEKDDIVRIMDFQGNQVGVGKVNCDSKQAQEAIGKHGKKPVVHYDYLYIE